MPNLRTCLVSFSDLTGVRHSAEVTAESLFEAAVLGIAAIAQSSGAVAATITQLEIEVRAPIVRHQLSVRQVRQWVDGVTASPKEKLVKERLRQMLPPE
ncbi:MAG: hypothetical protein JNK87_09905 [Bryobacterales bacterium]|nr:hypothetical protein [Bryobacterales bacterium]